MTDIRTLTLSDTAPSRFVPCWVGANYPEEHLCPDLIAEWLVQVVDLAYPCHPLPLCTGCKDRWLRLSSLPVQAERL